MKTNRNSQKAKRPVAVQSAMTLPQVLPQMPLSRLSFVAANALVATPPTRNWLIEGIVPGNALGGMIAPPEWFKSAIATDMTVSITTAQPWHGFKVKAGPVLILAGEGHEGYGRRLKAIAEHRGINLTGAPLYVSRSGISLLNAEDLVLLKMKFEKVFNLRGMYPKLLVIDTLARNFGAGDENSAADMGKFIDNLDSLRRKYGCTVIVVHHTGHANANRARGSSSFRAALDFEISIERKGDQAVVKCSKSKDAEKFAPIAFQKKAVKLRWKIEGKTVRGSSFVMERIDASKVSPENKQEAALQLLKKLESDDPLAQKAGIQVSAFRAKLIEHGVIQSTKAFERLKKRMVDAGTIQQPDKGFVRSK